MTDRDQLIDILATRSARRGSFILASGRKSTLYIDARLTTMSPDGLPLIGALGLATLQNTGWAINAIGGLTLGADPITYAISYASAASGFPLRSFTVRKTAKTHGTGQRIEGPFQSGDCVVIIEDVITTGRSALTAIEAVQDAGGLVQGVLALVDRQEGGREALEAIGLPVISLITATEILARMPHN